MDRRYGSLISEEKNAMKDFDADKISGELDYLLAICKLKGLKKEDFIDHINKKWENKND